MKQFAVIGHPIGHSLSPLMHNTAFKHHRLECHYDMMDVDPLSLKETVEQFRDEKWGGFNVTVPYKEAIMPYLDDVVPEARAVGAVNTVVHRDNNLIGYNTDVLGVERSLQAYREKILGNRCTILGSGGVARAVVHVLVHTMKIDAVTFSALVPEQARALIGEFGGGNVHFNVLHCADRAVESAIKDSALIINATAVGMYPHILESPIPNRDWLSDTHIVFDLVYRPLVTQLLSDAKTAGAKTIDGLGMFIHQGAAAYQLWTGLEMPRDLVRTVLEDVLKEG